MAKPLTLFPTITALVIVLLLIMMTSSAAEAGVGDLSLGWAVVGGRGGGCRGSTAECIAEEESEFEMDSEINRRILATNNYISYQALQRNSVPCSRRGASYYNCQAGAQANPYSRGCSAIARCRS